MKLSEIYAFLNELSPFALQEAWDNSGILLGNENDEITQIYLGLDLDEGLIEEALENSLFITHHPLIFSPLKDLAGLKYPRALLKKMIQKNIALIAMHTHYDKTHLNAYFAEQILGFKDYEQEGFVLYAKVDLNFKELINLLKERLKLKHIHASVVDEKAHFEKIALCTGSGASLINELKAECFLTGDIKYHQAFEALQNGITLIDIKHYESEICFAHSLAKHLQNLPIKVIITLLKNPFQYF